MNAHLKRIVAALKRHRQSPPALLLDRFRNAEITETEFRAALGIRPVTPESDAFGEFWRSIPGWPEYDASNEARVRTYWHPDHDKELCTTPQRVLRRQMTSGSPKIKFVESAYPFPFRLEDLMDWTFGPGWGIPPILNPDPPGVTWRAIPGWPAYEVSRRGMVRSYHELPHKGIADTPQRLLRPMWDDVGGRRFVRLADGQGYQEKIPIARLVNWSWGRSLHHLR
jgi:hypothetical protein